MKLIDLEPAFLKVEDQTHFRHVIKIEEADGVWFLCPKCFRDNGGAEGTHGVVCWRPKVPQSISPVGGRWEMRGTGLHDLSLVAGSSSVHVGGGCNAHFFVTDGEIQDA